MATMPRKPPGMPPSPHTGRRVKELAAEGLARPSKLTAAEVRELAGSVMAHIEPRASNQPPPPKQPKTPNRGKRGR